MRTSSSASLHSLSSFASKKVAAVKQHFNRAGAPRVAPFSSTGSKPRPPAASPRMASLSKINLKVANFRDLHEANTHIQPGRIWRCARPSSASEADVCILLDQLGVKDLIDLRSTEELSEDPYYDPYARSPTKESPGPLASSSTAQSDKGTAVSASSDTSAPASENSVPSTSGTPEKSDNRRAGRTLLQGTQFRRYLRQWFGWQAYVEQKGPENAAVVHHQVSLLERNRFYRALLTHIPPANLAKATVLGLLRYKEQSRIILLREVNAGGLGLLYKIIIDSAQLEIKTVLELILRSLQQRRPVLFFCKAGKDRTGIIAALVLACSGASDVQIVEDYARSDAFHAVALAGIENKPELKGLDRSAFERSGRRHARHDQVHKGALREHQRVHDLHRLWG